MRFGRKSGTSDPGTGDPRTGDPGSGDPGTGDPRTSASGQAPRLEDAQAGADTGPSDPSVGPFDATEVDVEERDCIDLGGLLITPIGQVEMQLQVDEASGQVIAAVLVGQDGALELRAFAASRGGGAWDELRPRIAAETARLGGTCDGGSGPFGAELRCMVPVQGPDGQAAVQASRVMAHEGPAWLLRATLMGEAAQHEELPEAWEATIRQVVVRRGREAMPPGAPLHLHLPPEARRVGPPASD